MAPPKGRARNPAAKKRIAEQRAPRRGARSGVTLTGRKRANTPYRRRRRAYDSVSIPQLVYELLTVDKYNRDARRSQESFLETPPRRMRGYHERQRLSYEAVDRHNSSESIRVPDYMMESGPTSVESLTEVTDVANSSAPTSSANSSVSHISTEPITLADSLNSARALFKKKSLVQLINSYIKAGIEEGKRQAKKYIRKALSFGVRSGYLTPADARGSVLRVCPTLTSSRTSDAESRQKRRIARRGETRLTTIDDRRAMRRGVPAIGKTSRRDVRAKDTAATSARRRYRGHPSESPTGSLCAKNDSLRKSPDRSRPREKNKSTSGGGARKNSKIDERANNKQGQQQRKRDNGELKKPVKRRRTALSPRRAGDDREPVMESYANANDRDRDRYKSNEDNYGTVTERRKSSRENESRVERQKTGMNIDEDRNVERRDNGDDDDEKSEEASVERDANGTTTGETNV